MQRYKRMPPATVVQVSDTLLVVTVPVPSSGEMVGQIAVATDAGKTVAAQEIVLGNESNASLSRSITVYPNPTNGKVAIDFSNAATQVRELEVINSMGQKTVSLKIHKPARSEEVDLSGAGAGLYVILLKTDRGVVMKRVVVR